MWPTRIGAALAVDAFDGLLGLALRRHIRQYLHLAVILVYLQHVIAKVGMWAYSGVEGRRVVVRVGFGRHFDLGLRPRPLVHCLMVGDQAADVLDDVAISAVPHVG